ncbi:MAG: hypothetical protein RIS86_1477 [Planctomycetota bacterium]
MSLFAKPPRDAALLGPGPLFAPPSPARRPDAALRLAVLASSSAGNASVVVADTPRGRVQLLLDAGLSPRATRAALASLGLRLEDTAAILFTHFDQDHAKASWGRVAQAAGLRLVTARAHRREALARGYPDGALVHFDPDRGAFDLDGLRIAPCENPHDDGSTIAFRIESAAGALGYATDLGRVRDELVAALGGVSLLAIESNYDPAMQLASARPEFLKRRIMGGAGHLSNAECADAVARIAARAAPERIVLLHLSRQCNDPALVRALWRTRLPHLADRLEIARHDAPVGPLSVLGAAQEPSR